MNDILTKEALATGEAFVTTLGDVRRVLDNATKPLHKRIAQLESDLAAAREEIARLKDAVSGFRCTCYCLVHGGGCGGQEATCCGIVQCDRCKTIDAARAGGGR